jgi:ABC-type lipoprotein export system ATPase subunit
VLPELGEIGGRKISSREMTKLGNNVPGARWLRCDLHVHTPFDGEKTFGEDLRAAIEALKQRKPQRLAEIADRFVQACRDAAEGEGIDLVALTDHNSIDGYRYLKPQFDTLAQQARDQKIAMPAILPGVEFSVGGERPIHFLVIFAANTNPDAIDRAITHVFGTADRFDPARGTPRATGQSVDDFLKRLYEYCRPLSGDRTLEFVVLPAHADSRQGVSREVVGGAALSSGEVSVATTLWDEMKGHLRERVISRRDWHGFQTSRPFENLPRAFQELLWRWSAARRGEDWDQLTQSQRARYREQRHWPLVECSDPHVYEAIGSRYAWLKMEVPDIEGIRLALLDPESRLRRMADGPPGQRYPRIERLRVCNTDFFEDVNVPLSPCLTTLVGGRGSGKSTLIEYLRYALDRDHKEDFGGEKSDETRGAVERILKDKRQRDFGETPGTLLPDYELELELVVAERRYRLRRDQEGIGVIRDPGTPSEEAVPLDVRSLVSPRILSQGQIARIAKDPAAQRHELDALLDPDRLAEIEDTRRSAQERLQDLQSKRSRLKKRRATLPGRKTELQKVEDQIAFLEQAGGKEVLARFQAFEQERQWLDGALEELGRQAERLKEQTELVQAGAAELPDLPVSAAAGSWMETVRQRVIQQLEKAAAVLTTETRALRDLSRHIEQERAEQWQPDYERVRGEVEALREELATRGIDSTHHEKLLQQRMLLKREIQQLEVIGQELERVAKEIGTARSELVQIHERRLELRRRQAGSLEELDADVRLEILAFQDRKDFESRREEWFAGAGLQERDWTAIADYVFAPNGSVAENIAALVECWRADVEVTADQGRAIDASESCVMILLDSGDGNLLTKNFLNALERADRLRLDELERFLPEDSVELRVRGAGGEFTPITTGSVGQRSTAILSLLLSAGDQPLIIDQPEDDLDNRYIYDVVVSLLRHGKFSRQILIATHNANIPVNGDAELIVALGVEDRLGTVLACGSIDRPEVKEQVSVIMEGSAEAFRLRRERYGY